MIVFEKTGHRAATLRFDPDGCEGLLAASEELASGKQESSPLAATVDSSLWGSRKRRMVNCRLLLCHHTGTDDGPALSREGDIVRISLVEADDEIGYVRMRFREACLSKVFNPAEFLAISIPKTLDPFDVYGEFLPDSPSTITTR